MDTPDKTIIGRVEKVSFPSLGNGSLYARIDTGAKTSSISATTEVMSDGRLKVEFLGFPSGAPQYFRRYSSVVVASSNGQAEQRYKVMMPMVLKKRRIRTHFTLTDRSSQVYPVLVGRNVLYGKYVVDVARGTPDLVSEKTRSEQLQSNEDS